ncbi:MAG: TldD/PmbA family protein [Sphaerochaetaceae bacterium]|nr:TldD/PmbA family protein [Sphaerochaetaceae bacterium]
MNYDDFILSISKEAERQNIENWELSYSVSESLSLSAFQGEIDSFSSQVDANIVLRVVIDGKEGSCSADSLSAITPEVLVENAKQYALYSDNENESIVFEGCKEYPEKTPYNVRKYSPTEARWLVLDALSSLLEADERISDSSKVYFDSVSIETRMANSHSLFLSNCSSGNALSFSVKAEEGGDVVTAFKSYDEDFENIDFKELSALATSQLGGKTLDSGVYKAILSPKVVSSFLSTYNGIFSGRANALGLARLKDKEGCLIASSLITLIDDPLYPGYSFQRTWDGDGQATRTKNVIDHGVLKTLLYNNEWALKCNKTSTGNGRRGSGRGQILPYSFYIKNGDKSLDDLYMECSEGILVTNIKGLHAGANSISGEFSLEASGFYIKEGKIVGAVKGFTIAGNFYELLEEVIGIGNDLEFTISLASSRYGSPSLLIKQLRIGGK